LHFRGGKEQWSGPGGQEKARAESGSKKRDVQYLPCHAWWRVQSVINTKRELMLGGATNAVCLFFSKVLHPRIERGGYLVAWLGGANEKTPHS